MTPDRHDENSDEPAEHGLLADTTNVDTAGIGILGARTARVELHLPANDDEDLAEDEVVDDVPLEEVATGDIILEEAAPPDDEPEPEPGAEADVHDADVVDDAAEDAGDNRPESTDEDGAGAATIHAGAPGAGSDATGDGAEPAAAEADAPDSAPDEPDEAEGEDAPADQQAAASEAPTTPPAPVSTPIGEPVPLTGAVPTTRREAHSAEAHARVERAHAVERVHPPQHDVDLTSKRLGEFEPNRETPDLLTADRLLDRGQLSGAEPEGVWQQLVYSLSRHRINLGDSKKVRARKALDRRIAGPLPGGARFVPVLSRKGGVGKTTVTTLLGMALASARDDRVIAIDANPDRGTLADRIGRTGGRTVRDLARVGAEVTGFNDISTIVARDETRLDVLASDADPRVSEAFSDRDYQDVAALAAHYYSLVLTDTGTGIVHSVMGATLEMADQIVVVAGLSIDEARLASETLTWLETNGYADQVRRAVVVLNNARPGSPLVRQSELETHFGTRVRSVVRVPYDPLIGSGGAISFRDLQPATREAARQLAAAVVEGLRAGVAAA
ncbi:MinD/ParA family protein [Microbacterium sp. 10M-3C3]|uniref:MinD/ParA family ATP-binding protein n=1 Tax=Microbacterium sp. 10M-3C3 TaxID=2483401 RepID=UPI000F63FC94|nr:MinD/ParA family protein [Microbacterium sp. 10M-3C3]